MGDTYRSVRGGMVNWGGFAMTWQDKERERYEKKLAERWDAKGNRVLRLRGTTGTLTISTEKWEQGIEKIRQEMGRPTPIWHANDFKEQD